MVDRSLMAPATRDALKDEAQTRIGRGASFGFMPSVSTITQTLEVHS